MGAVKPVDRRLDLARHRDPGQQVLARNQAHGVGGVGVERIGHGDRQTAGLLGDRQHQGLAQEARAQAFGIKCGLGELPRANQRQVAFGGKRLGQIAFGDQAKLGEQPGQALAALGTQLEGAFEPAAL